MPLFQCYGGPGQHKIGLGNPCNISRLQPTLPRGVVTNKTPFALCTALAMNRGETSVGFVSVNINEFLWDEEF